MEAFNGRSSFKYIGKRAVSRYSQPCTVYMMVGKNKDDGCTLPGSKIGQAPAIRNMRVGVGASFSLRGHCISEG